MQFFESKEEGRDDLKWDIVKQHRYGKLIKNTKATTDKNRNYACFGNPHRSSDPEKRNGKEEREMNGKD